MLLLMDDYRYSVSILDFIGTGTFRYSQNSVRIFGRRGNHEDDSEMFRPLLVVGETRNRFVVGCQFIQVSSYIPLAGRL